MAQGIFATPSGQSNGKDLKRMEHEMEAGAVKRFMAITDFSKTREKHVKRGLARIA